MSKIANRAQRIGLQLKYFFLQIMIGVVFWHLVVKAPQNNCIDFRLRGSWATDNHTFGARCYACPRRLYRWKSCRFNQIHQFLNLATQADFLDLSSASTLTDSCLNNQSVFSVKSTDVRTAVITIMLQQIRQFSCQSNHIATLLSRFAHSHPAHCARSARAANCYLLQPYRSSLVRYFL